MYEAVHARPDGESTVARMAATASDYGFDGIVVRNHGGLAAFDAEAVRDAYEVDVVAGVEVHADDPAQAGGYIGTYRPKATVLVLHGGSTELNRFAARQERVDVLAHPTDGGDVNHVLVRTAKEHGVRLEVNLARVLRTTGGGRVRAVAGLRKLRELMRAYDVPFVVSGDPANHLQIRAPRELVAVGETIGFEAAEIEAGLAEWARIATTNRERSSSTFVEPGVSRGRRGNAGNTSEGGTEPAAHGRETEPSEADR